MKHGPDLNRIGRVIVGWQKGVITFEETERRLLWLMEPANFLPEVEQASEIPRGESAIPLEILKRIEQKLNIVIKYQDILLPDELNPEILAEDVKELANENRKIEAVQLHRARTGAGLAEAVRVLDRFLQKREE